MADEEDDTVEDTDPTDEPYVTEDTQVTETEAAVTADELVPSGAEPPTDKQGGSESEHESLQKQSKHTDMSEDDEEAEACAVVCKAFCKMCKFAVRVYRNRFKRELVKSTIMFLLALKLSQECYSIVIPLRTYVPFE